DESSSSEDAGAEAETADQVAADEASDDEAEADEQAQADAEAEKQAAADAEAEADAEATEQAEADAQTEAAADAEEQAEQEEADSSSSSDDGSGSESSGSGSSEVSPELQRIAQCESGGNPSAAGPGGYRGKYQFSPDTWSGLGGSGDPAEASEAEQDRLAAKLYSQSGSSPWASCAG
ncbi:MAG: transglycosylase family protein, partial [Actinomycetota bacterium]|nr:transglycosylase family protein [Actinomycetota bacterium]